MTTSCIGLNNKELRQEDIGRRDDKDMDPQSPAHQDSAEVVSRFSALLRECSAVSDPKQAEKSCFSSSLLIFVRYWDYSWVFHPSFSIESNAVDVGYQDSF